jgi:uncharacterized protein YcgI (DUF1989 family)
MIRMRPKYPFDAGFYAELAKRRMSFRHVESHIVPVGGYGFTVSEGQTFRLVMVEGPQIIDLDIFNRDDVTEHYAAGSQFHLEGTLVTRFTRIWGTPPLSRPLATVIADTVAWRDNSAALRDHKSYGAHCHPHHWVLFAGRHPRTCYDNLRAGVGMLGLSQRHVHDNLNLFEKMGMDPYTGQHMHARSDAEAEDYLEFYAEVPLAVALSLCPYGDGSVPPIRWSEAEIPVRPVRIEIYDSDTTPLGWPYPVAANA